MNKYPEIESTVDWVNRFIEMRFPLDVRNLNIEGALKLKDIFLPTSIFKYREINENSIKNLKEDTIWLAEPSSFNDPFDCSIHVDFFNRVESKIKVSIEKTIIDSAQLFGIEELSLSEILKSDNPLISFNQWVLKDNPEQFEQNKFKINHNKCLVRNNCEKENLSNSNNLAKNFKLCSFSVRKDSMPMWAHYADNHKGFCIEYDLENVPASDNKRRFLYPVIYSDSTLDTKKHYDKEITDESFNPDYISVAALVKSMKWKYEKEWRLVFFNRELENAQPYHMGKPKAVYLGSEIKPKHECLIFKICTNKGIPCFKMKPQQGKFLMQPTVILKKYR